MEKKKKKRKGGYVAIPFLIAFLLGIVCIGGIAMIIFKALDPTDNTVHNMQGTMQVPTAENNFTLLFVLDEDTDPCPLTFTIARVLPAEKKIVLISLPSNMLTMANGKQYTLAESYRNGGVSLTKQAIANETGIEVDRYAIFDTTALQKLCNIYGGVMYKLPNEMEGFENTGREQYFGPSKIEKIITYPLFAQGEMQRSAVTSDILCDMLNQTDHERISSSMDQNFRAMINLMDTDITSIDYNDQESALKYMYNYGTDMAELRIVTGTLTEGKFVMDRSFPDSVAELFAEETEAEE